MTEPGATGTPTSALIIGRGEAQRTIVSATSHSLRAKNSSTGYQILRSKGAAPEQYPDYFFDDEDDYYDDEEEDPFE